MRSKYNYNCIVFLILKYKTKTTYFVIMSNNLIKIKIKRFYNLNRINIISATIRNNMRIY